MTIRNTGIDAVVIPGQLNGEEIERLSGINADELVRRDRDCSLIVPNAKRLRAADTDALTHRSRHSEEDE